MKTLILLAKAAIAFVWLVLLVNIVHPFPGAAAMALYIMTAFLFMMHGLQMLIFIGAFGDKITMSGWEKWSILILVFSPCLIFATKHMM